MAVAAERELSETTSTGKGRTKATAKGAKERCIALVLGGGAPNLTMMAGAVAALDEEGVKFDLISTSGAGMLIGLLYAAPKGVSRKEALQASVNMGVHDAIYNAFPVNYKVFHKPGPMAVAYTKFWQTMARQKSEWERTCQGWMNMVMGASMAGPWAQMYRSWSDSAFKMPVGGFADEADAKRFFEDIGALMLATLCPSDLNAASQGLCQWAPFIEEVVDFEKVKHFPGEFYLSAYCIEDREMVMFPKDQISIEHFQAALSFPFIYSPFKLDGKTYIEGAAVDTLNFKGLEDYREQRHQELKKRREQLAEHRRLQQEETLREELDGLGLARLLPPGLGHEHVELELSNVRKPLTHIIVCDILGLEELIGEPRGLYDAWVKSIIIPLTAVAEDDVKIFETQHLEKLGDPPGSVSLLRLNFREDMPQDHWPNVLDWSYSNLKTLFDVGFKAGKRFCAQNAKELTA